MINDSIALFLFHTLSYCAPMFCTYILFFYIYVCFELCGDSHLRATVYKFTFDWIKKISVLVTFFIFLYFYTLIFHVLSKVLVKIRSEF